MADDDWLFGANKVDEKLVIGEPEQSGKHTQPAKRERDGAEGRRDTSAPPSGRAHAVNHGRPHAPSTPVGSNAAASQQRDAATTPPSGSSMESQRRDDTVPIQRGALAGMQAPAPRQADDSTPANRDTSTPPQSGGATPPQRQYAPPAPLQSSTPLSSDAAVTQQSGGSNTPATDDFDPWADDAEDVDDSWTVGTETPLESGTSPSSNASMPLQSGYATERQPRQPAGQNQEDGWFAGQEATAPQSVPSTPHRSVPSPVGQSDPSTAQQSDDDWFTESSMQQAGRPSATPQSVPSTAPQSNAGMVQPDGDDWFTGGPSTPPQSSPTAPPASGSGMAPEQTPDGDDWFTGNTSTPQQSDAVAAQPLQPSTPEPDAGPTMGQQPTGDGWFDSQQSSPSTAPQSHTSATPSMQQDDSDDWFDNPAPQQSGPSTPQQATQDPWGRQDRGGETQQQGDDWFTPATGADTMPTTDDPWADPTPAGEWNQTTQPAQAATMPIPQPQSYSPTPAAPVQPDIEESADNETDGKAIWKPLLVILACVLALGLIGFGGYYGYNAYHRNMEERAAQEASQQALKELNKSKASYEADRKQARALVTKMCTGIVKDDPDVVKQAEALDRLASLSMPRTKKTIGEADTTLNKQYEKASETYQSKVKAKCDAVAKALADLAGQSDQLASAPDSTDKATMQSLAKKWRDKTVSEDSYADAVKAQTDLQNAVNAVRAAKEQADAAAQQAQQQAEAQAQAQAQAQQQQSQKKSTTTQKRSSSSGSTQRRQSTPQQTTAPQPAPQPAQPSTPSGESGVNLG